jgi:hypothetical protein
LDSESEREFEEKVENRKPTSHIKHKRMMIMYFAIDIALYYAYLVVYGSVEACVCSYFQHITVTFSL